MINEATQDVIEGIIAITILLLVLYGPWQKLVVSYARQRLFEIRDSVFDLAASEHLDFDSPEYKEIRQRLNAFIRFAHKVTWIRVIAFGYALRNTKDTESAKLFHHLVEGDHLKKIMRKNQIEVLVIIFTLMALRSPLFLIVLPVALPIFTLIILFSPSDRTSLERKAILFTRKISQESNLVM